MVKIRNKKKLSAEKNKIIGIVNEKMDIVSEKSESWDSCGV
jgi:hypothetical protein